MFLFSIALHGEIDVSTCQWQGTLLSLMFAISANVGKCFFGWMVVWGEKIGLKRWCIAGSDTDQRKTQDI